MQAEKMNVEDDVYIQTKSKHFKSVKENDQANGIYEPLRSVDLFLGKKNTEKFGE